MNFDLSVLNNFFKKGMHTSEFWVVIAAVIYNAAMNIYDPTRPFTQQVPSISIAVAAAVYALARTGLKTKRLSTLEKVAVGGALLEEAKGAVIINEDEPTATDTNVQPTQTP